MNVFISHSSEDDDFVRELRVTLGYHGVSAWIDSRELLPGGLLEPDIQRAIESSGAFAVVVSGSSLQSKWVGRELRHALELQKQRGRDKYPVVLLSLDGTKLGVLEQFFDGEPKYISISSDAGGIDAAVPSLLVALGQRLPADIAAEPRAAAQPLEDLVLELTALAFDERDGLRRASARARLVYQPATAGQPQVSSAQAWRFIAPLGPIEAEELRWYLEKFAIWPSEYFRDRARKVEASLVTWGQLLHDAALPPEHAANVMKAWARIDDRVDRRFSVYVDATLEAGASAGDAAIAREAAAFLMGLPWELLHDGADFLFQGAKPTRVRRRLPNTNVLDVPVVATPIRILLVTARPEDDACPYIDHRASALPLVETMEALGALVHLHVLNPPTLLALRDELDRARRAGQSYHVVHFDGHGVYDRRVGLGGLCFEDPRDAGKLQERRHATVMTNELGPLLRDYRIPLVFLEACQTAQAGMTSESVASELLKVGVASVVAMSHSVLVGTTRRFVEAFYAALARGARVGDAVLAGQRTLKDDPFRGRVFGAGELRLDDWFVPVLFQEKDDPQLFRTTPSRQVQEDVKHALVARLGDLPPEPETGFIGRSRELLALQRLLLDGRYAVIRGQGGEGKTALAAEFARWMVRSRQIRRAAFVSLEGIEKNIVESVLDRLGRQLVKASFSTQVDCAGDLARAEMEIVRALTEQPTLLLLDNMESILPPPYVDTPRALSEDARQDLDAMLALCARLDAKGDTRLIFTSRETLPEPFAAEARRRELSRLHRDEAVKLVERALDQGAAGAGDASDAAVEDIEQLVEAVNGHARTLALLAPSLRTRGVAETKTLLVELMREMERKFPNDREHSLFASVELSLRRMSAVNQRRARVLAAFHGGFSPSVLQAMTEWDQPTVGALSNALVETGLATARHAQHVALDPALGPYLRGRVTAPGLAAITSRWVPAMSDLVERLHREQTTATARAVTLLELPNLFALVELVERNGDAETTIHLVSRLFSLLQLLGRPRLLERLAKVRDAAAAALADRASHAWFEARRTEILQRLGAGQVAEALDGAERLLQRMQAQGETAYAGADYDVAMAFSTEGRVLKAAGRSEEALARLAEAQRRFEAIDRVRPESGAARMVAVCHAERADCHMQLGRVDEAAAVYEEAIRQFTALADERQIGAVNAQIGTIRLMQGRHQDALDAYREARERFEKLGEPASVATSWHQEGIAYHGAGQHEAAEDAFRNALNISVQLGDVASQARTLNQLGLLYDQMGRTEEASVFVAQAVDKYVELKDAMNEGKARTNLAIRLARLNRFDEARQQITLAIELKGRFGAAALPWSSWNTLADIERASGNPAAALAAKQKAVEAYLAYRRAGGENQSAPGAIVREIAPRILAGDAAGARSWLEQLAARPGAATLQSFIEPLEAVVAGARDRAVADAADLDYMMAAELLWLIETLERSESKT